MKDIRVRKLNQYDHLWVTGFLTEHWDSPQIVTRGNIHNADRLSGFIAETANKKTGLITYQIQNNECEIISLNSIIENAGIGTALLNAVIEVCSTCRRVWLITTNDNLRAIEFYKRRGFKQKAVYTDAIAESRKLKPSIPEIGINGIPIRDEIEFEYILSR